MSSTRPEHKLLASAASLSHFLNYYAWPTRRCSCNPGIWQMRFQRVPYVFVAPRPPALAVHIRTSARTEEDRVSQCVF